jgi:hypothetical protein
MTRDQPQRDREALQGSVIVGWYCPRCRKAIPISDEKTCPPIFATLDKR